MFPGRHTAHIDGDFVVFIIGMRINRPWKPHKWLPVLMAMPPMVKELEARARVGLPRREPGLSSGGPALVQYWRSFEDLRALRARRRRAATCRHGASSTSACAAPATSAIWHETYRVHAGDYEAVYGNMPRIGLAAAAERRPLVGSTGTAARRIGARPDDTAPIEYSGAERQPARALAEAQLDQVLAHRRADHRLAVEALDAEPRHAPAAHLGRQRLDRLAQLLVARVPSGSRPRPPRST